MEISWNLEIANFLKSCFLDAGLVVFFLLFCVVYLSKKGKYWNKVCYFFLFVLLAFWTSSVGSQILYESLMATKRHFTVSEAKLGEPPKSSHADNDPTSCFPLPQIWVVLGGGSLSDSLPTLETLARVKHAARLYQVQLAESKPKIIVFSGGFTIGTQEPSEAEVMKYWFSILYPDIQSNYVNLLLEQKSLNTAQNAQLTREVLHQKKLSDKILLITSDYHMFRAGLVFRKAGFRVCEEMVLSYDFGVEQFSGFRFRSAVKSNKILNEYFGLLGYWLKGWI